MEVVIVAIEQDGVEITREKFLSPITAEKALDTLQATDTDWVGRLTEKDGDVIITGTHLLHPTTVYCLHLQKKHQKGVLIIQGAFRPATCSPSCWWLCSTHDFPLSL
jgi:hypothetical protein